MVRTENDKTAENWIIYPQYDFPPSCICFANQTLGRSKKKPKKKPLALIDFWDSSSQTTSQISEGVNEKKNPKGLRVGDYSSECSIALFFDYWVNYSQGGEKSRNLGLITDWNY